MINYKIVTILYLIRSFFLNRELARHAECIVNYNALNIPFYKSQRPRNIAAQLNPVAHYILWGESQGLWPNPNFSPRDYIKNNPSHAHEIKHPLWHYLEHGQNLGLSTLPQAEDPSKIFADLEIALSQSTPRPFSEQFTYREDIHGINHEAVVIFSHFDAQSIIDDHVVYAIKNLAQYGDIVFVSTSEDLSGESLNQISDYCRSIIIKKNEGYDFGAWRTGMNAICDDLPKYDKLILCNDSVYGPFYPLDDFFDEMKSRQYDVFSMTQCHDMLEHYQSYFTAYSKKGFTSNLFKEFWNNMMIYDDKKSLILSHEVMFSNSLIRSELHTGSYVPIHTNPKLNITHFGWKSLIVDHRFPFMKVELLRDNPMMVDISDWEKVITSVSKYDTKLIKNHLKRIKTNNHFRMTS